VSGDVPKSKQRGAIMNYDKETLLKGLDVKRLDVKMEELGSLFTEVEEGFYEHGLGDGRGLTCHDHEFLTMGETNPLLQFFEHLAGWATPNQLRLITDKLVTIGRLRSKLYNTGKIDWASEQATKKKGGI